MLRKPQISVDGVSYLKPELIGLSVYLGLSGVYSGDVRKVLSHVSRTGTLDGLTSGLLIESQIEAAKLAHSEWQDFIAQFDAPIPAPTAAPEPYPHFLGRVNGRLDAAGVNGQADPEDIEF